MLNILNKILKFLELNKYKIYIVLSLFFLFAVYMIAIFFVDGYNHRTGIFLMTGFSIFYGLNIRALTLFKNNILMKEYKNNMKKLIDEFSNDLEKIKKRYEEEYNKKTYLQ